MMRLAVLFALFSSVGCVIAETPNTPHRSPASARFDPGESEHHESKPAESDEQEEGDEVVDLPPYMWDRLLRYHRPDPYLLDHMSRVPQRDRRGRLECPDLDIVRYRGETIRYYRTVWVHTKFRERLKRFEKVAARVGEEVYGRAPDRLFQRGTLVCKVIKRRDYQLSEHALGNAIDIVAFGFPPLPRDERDDADGLGGRFRIDVEEDWAGEEDPRHAVFFRKLSRELHDEFVFRGIIVPPAPGHHDHLHLDMGPWRYLRGDVSLEGDEGSAPGRVVLP